MAMPAADIDTHSQAPDAALSVAGLTVTFPGPDGPTAVVEDVGFSIPAGAVLGLVGESGAGKSMIGKALIGLVEAPGRVAAGRVTLDGSARDARRPKALAPLRGRRIGSVFQDPMTSLNPLLTVGDQLAETIATHTGLNGEAARRRGLDLLDQVGLPEPAARWTNFPHQLSGGMRQRVVIALALAGEPRVIVADEPTTALDVSLQAQITGLLQRLCRDNRIAVLLITHDMGVVAETADRVAVMRAGRIVEAGPAAQVLAQPRHAYTRALLACIPQPANPRPRLPTVAAPSPAVPAARRMHTGDGAARQPILGVHGLRKSFAGGRGLRDWLTGRRPAHLAAADISFALYRGETLALVGESGSGKTTVARCVAGLLTPESGAVTLDGMDWRDPGVRRRHRGRLQMIFQDPFSSLNPRLRVGAIIAEPLKSLQPTLSPAQRRARIAELLGQVGLPPDSAERFPHAFSGGQRQRIAIARALAAAPDVLICDEPTSALDVSVQAQILNLMRDLQDSAGLGYLFITHDLGVVHHMADRVIVMQQGRIVESGPCAAVFGAPQHPYTRSLLAAIPRLPQAAA